MSSEAELFHGYNAPVSKLAAKVVAVVDGEATLHDVCRKLASVEVGALPVVTDGEVIGIVTERDIVNAIAQGAYLDKTTAADVATKQVKWITADTTCGGAVRAMLDAGTRHLAVGGPDTPSLLSARDLLRALADG
jgi:CBS domain-containing protein